MFDHPFTTAQTTAFDAERVGAEAERRRFLREHADQIVTRPAGPVRRFLRRNAGRRGSAMASDAPPRARRAVSTGDPVAAR